MDPEMMMGQAPMAGPPMGGPPMMPPEAMGGGMEAPELGGDQMLAMMLQELIGGWQDQEGEIDSQKMMLAQMLMQMLQSQQPAVDPYAGYMEGSMSPVAGSEIQ